VPALLLFIFYFAAILFAGALFSYPFYVIVNLVTDREYSEIIMDSTKICGLAFSFFYLYLTDTLTLAKSGLAWVSRVALAKFASGFAGGFAIILLLMISLLLLGIYGFDADREFSAQIIVTLLISSLATGLAVGLFEETVFRGCLFSGLSKQTNVPVALLTISLVYAAVHFIDYPVVTGSPHWLTGVNLFIPAHSMLINLETIDAFAALFMLGVLLSLVRIHNGNIIQCIGLHAGLVTGIKIARYITEYIPGNRFDFLVSSYDHRLGFLALLLMLVATLLYYFSTLRNQIHM